MAQYATTTDLAQFGLPAAALANISTTIQNDHLTKAGGVIDSYLRSHHTLPLGSPYPDEIIRCNAIIAAYDILQFRGFNPDEFDEGFRLRYLDCLAWLKDIAKGLVSLAITADATAASEGRPRVETGGADIVYGSGTRGNARGW